MQKLSLFLLFMLSVPAIAAFPPKGWKMGTCQEVKNLLSSELQQYQSGFFNKLEEHYQYLEKKLDDVKDVGSFQDLTLEEDYSGMQTRVSQLQKALLRDCSKTPYVYRGEKGSFSMLRFECLNQRGLTTDISFLAVKKGDRSQKLYQDGREHLVVRVCLDTSKYFKRASGVMTWLKTDISYCLNYDVLGEKYFSYRHKKALNTIGFEDTNVSLGYSYTHFDPTYRMTPGGVTSSEYISASDKGEGQKLLEKLLTPTRCGNSQHPIYHQEDYLNLVPGENARSCPWYDLSCWFKNN